MHETNPRRRRHSFDYMSLWLAIGLAEPLAHVRLNLIASCRSAPNRIRSARNMPSGDVNVRGYGVCAVLSIFALN